MSEVDLIIEAFRDLGLIEVVGLGCVRKLTGNAQEHEIEILVNGIDAAGRWTGPPRDAWIGCGQLDLVPVGSRWQDGRLVGFRQRQRSSGSANSSALEPVGLTVEDTRPLSAGRRPAQRLPTDLHSRAPCFRLDLKPVPGSAGGSLRVEKAAVPVMEVLRVLFGPSDVLLRQLFDGLRDRTPVPGRLIYDRQRSGRLADGKTISLVCDRLLGDDEAQVAAMMVASERVRRSHDGVNSMLRATREWSSEQPAYAVTTWPFDEVVLHFEGEWITRAAVGTDQQPRSRFLITRILKIVPRLDFDIIELSYPTTATDDGAPPTAAPGAALPSSGPKVATRGKAPSPAQLPVRVRSGNSIWSAGPKIVLRPRPQGTRPEPRIRGGRADGEEGEVSTGDVQPGADPSVGPLKTDRRSGRRRAAKRRTAAELSEARAAADVEAEISREQTLGAVQNLAARGWQVVDVTVPSIPVAVAVIVRPARRSSSVLIVDAGTSTDDARSLGVVARIDGGDVTAVVPEMLVTLKRTGGRWRNKAATVSGCVVRGFSRRDDQRKVVRDYADLIAQAIEATLSAAADARARDRQ